MAGDWIKMRTALADDPAVIAMADSLDADEFTIVGRLHHIWSWADAQSRDGHAKGVTQKWINRYVRCDGFAEAMVAVGWLEIVPGGILFPHFDRHNGESAKARGLAANRKQKQRASVTPESQDMSRTERDECVTREEKRREEQNKGSNGDGGQLTESPVDNSSPLAAAEIVKNLNAWEVARDKQPKPVVLTDAKLVALAAKNVTPGELRVAYDRAVAARLKSQDGTAINPGFVALFVDEIRLASVAAPVSPEEWGNSASGIQRKAASIGVKVHPEESMPALKMRILMALERAEQPA